MREYDGIPEHIAKSELSQLGVITHVFSNDDNNVRVAHIQQDAHTCSCILFRDTMDGVAPLDYECTQCNELVDLILALASNLVHKSL